ncbi:type II secretion system protein GspM [Variovorax sp. RHLX14]|uniref:type II secretion system protein GspM n=1 Tax=Variovorax sp. RHLX14 TaxID=1259731 RepID=UPI003F453A0A
MSTTTRTNMRQNLQPRPAGNLRARANAWWKELGARERQLVMAAGALVLLALLWWVCLAPALRTLASAPAAHAQLDVQLQQMVTLQAQARALQAQPRVNRDDALRALESTVRQGLGANAQMQVAGGSAGDGVLVTLGGTPPDALVQWLSQARGNARAVPREVHLTRSQVSVARPIAFTPAAAPGAMPGLVPAPAAAASGPTRARWDGTLVMSLPAPR